MKPWREWRPQVNGEVLAAIIGLDLAIRVFKGMKQSRRQVVVWLFLALYFLPAVAGLGMVFHIIKSILLTLIFSIVWALVSWACWAKLAQPNQSKRLFEAIAGSFMILEFLLGVLGLVLWKLGYPV